LLKTFSDYDVYYLSEWPLVHSILSPVRLSRTVQEWCEVLEGRFLFLEKLAAKSSEHHIAVSEFTLERAKRILNLERIALVPTPLKLEEIRSYRKPRIEGRIVYAGRLMLHKHVDLLISSFHEVRREMPCAELHIVGVGPEEPMLKKMAERVDGVTMWGNLSDPDLYALLSTASVFALASEREGDGISALEAMAFGVPIVTSLSRNNAAVRFAEEGAGISVLPDIGKFSEACMKIMSDTDLWRKFSRQATQIAERRNVDKIGVTLAGILKEVAFK
jgi:glycosyltransferase involved in cell wall biosynthesis